MIIDFKKKKTSLSSTCFLDQIKIVSAVTFILALATYLFLDKPLALAFHSLPTPLPELFRFFERLFCPVAWVLITPAIFFYIRFILKKEKKSRKFWYVSLTLPLSILVCKIAELAIGKATPEWFFLHGEVPFRFFEWNRSFHSFPAIASVTMATFASALACILPNSRLYLLIGGFLLSLTPVLSTGCFLSDAIAGFYLGVVSSQWIFRKMKREVSM